MAHRRGVLLGVLLGQGACSAPPAETDPPPSDRAGDTGVRMPAEIRSISDAPSPFTAHARALAIELTRADAVEVRCFHTEEADEVHAARSDVAVESHTLRLIGLLAPASYACEVRADSGAVGAHTLHTDPSVRPPPSLTIPTPGPADLPPRYFLLSHAVWVGGRYEEARFVVLDRRGRVRWSVDAAEDHLGYSAQPTADGILIGTTEPTLLDGWGSALWTLPTPDDAGAYYHHDAILGSDGVAYAIRMWRHGTPGDTWAGYAVEGFDSAQQRVFHFDTQAFIDRGLLRDPPGSADPLHPNAVVQVTDDRGPSVWVSQAAPGSIVRLDRTTGEPTWMLGSGGHWALQDEAGNPLPDREWFSFQHAPDVIWPRVLVFDNGSLRPGPGPLFSRVVEYRLDPAAMTATRLRSWTEPGWYEPHFGSVRELPNGQWLIGSGHHKIPGSIPELRSFIAQVEPDTGAVVFRLSFDRNDDAIYRAEPMSGCGFFTREGDCLTGSPARTPAP